MSHLVDNRLVAATLAAPVIAKLELGAALENEAVRIYNEILKRLDEQSAKAAADGIDSYLSGSIMR
ncbi:hypothetical protein [Tardiphaga robiniae]|uniref:hypothetical protein n=1 Tax=Tardiphaga robiniae TaxID=943830 RepID=UPI001586229E|nr:hypothetical protein [Tardiphaga robiniae]NUU44544.1 hypothetical protein [Tardiphaga robiniae]